MPLDQPMKQWRELKSLSLSLPLFPSLHLSLSPPPSLSLSLSPPLPLSLELGEDSVGRRGSDADQPDKAAIQPLTLPCVCVCVFKYVEVCVVKANLCC